MKRKRIRIWIATIVVGVLLIPTGIGWIVYTVTKTGQYDSNAEFTDPETHVASHGGYVSDAAWPFLGFALSFGGGILITVGSLGLTFSWLAGSDEDDDAYTRSSDAFAAGAPTTRIGWGSETTPGSNPGAAPGSG
jgi:hypothetical protein